jgi:hypothetical protein
MEVWYLDLDKKKIFGSVLDMMRIEHEKIPCVACLYPELIVGALLPAITT